SMLSKFRTADPETSHNLLAVEKAIDRHYRAMAKNLPSSLLRRARNKNSDGLPKLQIKSVVERWGTNAGILEASNWHTDPYPFCLVNLTPDIACTEQLKASLEQGIVCPWGGDILPDSLESRKIEEGIAAGRYSIFRCTIPGQMTLQEAWKNTARSRVERVSIHRRSANSGKQENRFYVNCRLDIKPEN
ncbi:MAG: hypothetical protein AAB802_00200, partial [Patescibacteria group bacterium]